MLWFLVTEGSCSIITVQGEVQTSKFYLTIEHIHCHQRYMIKHCNVISITGQVFSPPLVPPVDHLNFRKP